MVVWIHLSQENIGLDDAKQRGVADRQGENEEGRFGMVSRIIPIDRWVFTGMITRLKFHKSRENISSSEGRTVHATSRGVRRGGRGALILSLWKSIHFNVVLVYYYSSAELTLRVFSATKPIIPVSIVLPESLR